MCLLISIGMALAFNADDSSNVKVHWISVKKKWVEGFSFEGTLWSKLISKKHSSTFLEYFHYPITVLSPNKKVSSFLNSNKAKHRNILVSYYMAQKPTYGRNFFFLSNILSPFHGQVCWHVMYKISLCVKFACFEQSCHL